MTFPHPTFRITCWRSKKDGQHYFALHCVENGEEILRQSEGLATRSEVLRRVADVFSGLWPVERRKGS